MSLADVQKLTHTYTFRHIMNSYIILYEKFSKRHSFKNRSRGETERRKKKENGMREWNNSFVSGRDRDRTSEAKGRKESKLKLKLLGLKEKLRIIASHKVHKAKPL